MHSFVKSIFVSLQVREKNPGIADNYWRNGNEFKTATGEYCKRYTSIIGGCEIKTSLFVSYSLNLIFKLIVCQICEQTKSMNQIEFVPKRKRSISMLQIRSKDQTEFDNLNDVLQIQHNELVKAEQEHCHIINTLSGQIYKLEIERVQLVGKLDGINSQLEISQENVCNAFFSMKNAAKGQTKSGKPNDKIDDTISSNQNQIRKLKVEYNKTAEKLHETDNCVEIKQRELNEIRKESHELQRRIKYIQDAIDSTYRKMIAPLLREAGHVGKKQFQSASQDELRKKFRVFDEGTIKQMTKENLRLEFIIPLVAGGHPNVKDVSEKGHKHGVKELRKSLLELFGFK